MVRRILVHVGISGTEDNCHLGGKTLDFGPFGFMEKYNPRYCAWLHTILFITIYLCFIQNRNDDGKKDSVVVIVVSIHACSGFPPICCKKSISGSWTGGAENFSFHLQPKAALANFRSAIRSLDPHFREP